MPRHDVRTEFWYDGDWHGDARVHTQDATMGDAMTITRGHGDEQSSLTPSTLVATVDNRTGTYNPRNPGSPLYGKIGLNTPARVYLGKPIVEDFEDTTLAITIGNGGNLPWARASDQAHGGAWSLKSGAITHSQTSDALITVPAGVNAMSLWWRVDAEDVFDKLTITLLYPDGWIRILVTASGPQPWTRLDADVADAATIRLRYEKDPSASSGADAAWVDDIIFLDQRAAAEISSWSPGWSPGWPKFGTAWTGISGSGVLLRLGEQGAEMVASPARRASLDPTAAGWPPVVYWPCEDGSASRRAASGLPGGLPLEVISGGVSFGSASPFSGSAALMALDSTGAVEADLPSDVDTSAAWYWSWLITLPDTVSADTTLITWWTTGASPIYQWKLLIAPTGALFMRAVGTQGQTLENATGLADFTSFRGQIQIAMKQVGANTQWTIFERHLLDDQTLNDYPGATWSYTFTNRRLGRCSRIRIGPTGLSTVWGHIGMATKVGWQELGAGSAYWILGYSGEPAGVRFSRVCTENGVPWMVRWDRGDTVEMGPQPISTVADIMADIERTDAGLLYEPRTGLGLTYRTRVSLYNEPPKLTLDWSARQVGQPTQPVIDSQKTRNDVTAQQRGGSSARAVQEIGPLNVHRPAEDPQGIGWKPGQVDVNPLTGTGLQDLAWWYLGLGTVDEARWPQVTVDLERAPELAALASAVDVGDRIQIVGAPADVSPDLVDLLVVGYTETPDSMRRLITFNCAPYRPYDVGVYDDPGTRYEGGITKLASDVNTTATSWSMTVSPPWWHADGDFDIRCEGERCTVTAISGTTSPQTWTVTRSVNGVVKAHPAGAVVELWHQARYAL